MVILANGAQLGWLQNPEQRAVEIWCASNVPGATPACWPANGAG
jgi:hypothetical protein